MRRTVVLFAFALAGCSAPARLAPPVTTVSKSGRVQKKPASRPLPPLVDEVAFPASSASEPAIPPLLTDLRIVLEPAVDPPAPVCTIHGTGRPFADPCADASILVSADEDGGVPVAQVDARKVDVRFHLAPGNANAWMTIDQAKVRIAGFAPLAKQTFRLSRDAVAFGGHVHLKAGAPVSIMHVGKSELSVVTYGDFVNTEDVVASAPCDSLSYDPAEDTQATGVESAPERGATSIGSTLHLAASPEASAMFTLERPPAPSLAGSVPAPSLSGGPEALPDSSLYLALKVVDRVRDQRRVVFSTERARFDVWVPSSEIDETGSGGGSGFGSFAGLCGGSSDGMLAPPLTVRRDVDVLVAKRPTDHGPRGVKLLAGARIGAWGDQNGWAEITIVDAPVSPPPGKSFWIPWRAVCAPRGSQASDDGIATCTQ